jgi:cytochrome c biogenesis protein CcmG, thiol:disulfide interchange protein DsbE
MNSKLGWALALCAVIGLVVWSGQQRDRRIGTPLATGSYAIVAGSPDERGDRIELGSLRGQVVVLDFWASFCPPCKASVPVLNDVAKRFASRGVAVLGVNAEALGEGALAKVAERWGMAYATLGDEAQQLVRAYRVEAFPTLLVFDREGRLRAVHEGLPGPAAIDSQIASLLD